MINVIGQGLQGPNRLHYTIDAECAMSVERIGPPASRRSFSLAGATIHMRATRDTEPYRVIALFSGSGSISLYEGTNRINAMHMDTIVKLLKRDCVAAAN